MDHGKARGPRGGKAAPEPLDVGDDPPLFVDGEPGDIIDRRRVSVQWFSGTVLTGLCGAALMAGAVYASLDGETYFAAGPERVGAVSRPGSGNTFGARVAAGARKSDRLPLAGEINSARHVVRVSTTAHAGDREVVRVRPYIRVASNLSLTVSELSANIPAFNPQRLLAEAAGGVAAEDGAAGAEPDPEVSFVTRDLASVLPRVKVAALVPIEDVVARVRDAATWSAGPTLASLPTRPLGYAPAPDPYQGFEARIVPENVTLFPKTATQATGGNSWNERLVTAKKGDTVTTILRDLGATPEEIKGFVGALGLRGRDGGLKEGQKLRILLSAAGPGQRLQPVRVMVLGDSAIDAVAALSDTGKYVAVDVQQMGGEVQEADEDDENDANAVRLYQSLYETALRNQVPRPVIDDLVRIYSYDVDFQRRTQPGDSFDVFYAGEDEPTADAKSEVLYASLAIGGETKKYYRYQTSDDGAVDYYDETGKSAKKFLVRKPVIAGIMRSGFGFRKHPILGYLKMHTGVDWGAPNGTPIYASGNGVVEKAGWESGYGKYVRLRHTNGYETAYGHMSGFARGIQPGVRVRQGQVIGYVGSTGLSTGAHLHYEIMVNGHFVDPMRIKLPRGRVLDGPLLAGFERERERIDGIMSRTQNRGGPPQRAAEAERR
ncbi:MAG TPA: M23 family metallopeptidase [Xanthobacteraceae bacterium]|nr:M23 family metallopeptidase [Xanthobacteraceae bacterium]